MSGYSIPIQTAIDKLKSFYNNGPWSAQNPGGLDNGGHRLNFTAALNDLATAAGGVADAATAAGAAAVSAATSSALAQQSVTTAAGSATAAEQSATTTASLRDQVQALLNSISGGPVASVCGKTGPAVALDSRDITLAARSVSANTTATAGELLILSQAITVNLPASPSLGYTVHLFNASAGQPMVGRNGSPIMGLAEDLTINLPAVWVTLRYVGGPVGWCLS
ncbi:hypothetical protein [Parachitinimonas caeni]|uniref:Tail fiber-like repeat protein n=1 Tax=Parachitinimonas caeni TaxID=3031301 RepID=A0ABT7DVQ8_9NEIS|nr:hypothetical protein [Parachitinimonas caeni]MDK2124144.1 hypothetical protein [Parachitinimonas caeni]